MSAAGKSLDPRQASRDTFQMLATTVQICSQSVRGNFATELLTVDPVAPLEEDCLIVFLDRRMRGPHMFRWNSAPAMDSRGRFTKGPRGYKLNGSILFDANDPECYIVGRVVGPPRDMGGSK